MLAPLFSASELSLVSHGIPAGKGSTPVEFRSSGIRALPGLEARIIDDGGDALEVCVEVRDTLAVEDVVVWADEVVGSFALAVCCASEPDLGLFTKRNLFFRACVRFLTVMPLLDCFLHGLCTGRDDFVDSGGPWYRRCRLENSSHSFFGFRRQLSEHFICMIVLAIMNKPPIASTSATPSVLNVL